MQVDYVDHMGTDLTVVNSARVSFNKTVKKMEAGDEKLIKFLASHNHFTPFTHAYVTLREKVPIFIARQGFKHVDMYQINPNFILQKPGDQGLKMLNKVLLQQILFLN
jgi:thymidylate synthase (FAD)